MVGRREQLGAVAATRFGLGARPGEIARLSTDPVGALLAQTRPEAAPLWAGRSHSAELIAEFRRLEDVEPDSEVRRTWRWGAAFEELLIRAQHASTTPYDFRERWITFWANTFALQVGDLSALLAGSFVREALEPHAFGRFADMAAASTRHPAMMLALDQVNSVGPNSAFGRATGQGLNENLARELMELHTLGADAGYSQTDVTEMARVLTGWRIGDADAPYPLRHRFQADPARREPGERRVLGRSWPESGERAETVVRWLADHPATASHMARKLARHFEADDPSPSLVERLRAAWRDGGGDLRLVAEALVTAPEMWRAEQRKFKTPYDFVVSVHRAAGTQPDDGVLLSAQLEGMGMHPLWSRTPEGWSDDASVWATPQGLGLRTSYALTHGQRSPAPDSRDFARGCLGPLLRKKTEASIALTAHDRASAFALVLMSPEFQRR